MLLVLLAIPVCVGFATGCCTFWICCGPGLRRFALATVLCCASWGVLSDAAILGNVVVIAALPHVTRQRMVALDKAVFEHFGVIGWTNVVLISFCATLMSLGHGFVVRRMTFALFRLYVASITVGIAVLSAVFVELYASFASYRMPWVLSLGLVPLLVVPWAAIYTYRHAAEFRGAFPEHLNWITRDEYESPLGRTVIGRANLPETRLSP